MTLREIDLFPTLLITLAPSSVFWTMNGYISQLGCCIGQISATIILCDQKKRKDFWWWTTIGLISCSGTLDDSLKLQVGARTFHTSLILGPAATWERGICSSHGRRQGREAK